MSLTRILHIEDSESVSYLIKEAFESHFSNVIFEPASTLQDAYNLLTTKHYDIVFYDLCFGYDFPLKIKDLKPGSLLIAMSAMLLFHDIPRCVDDIIFSQQVSPYSKDLKMVLAKHGFYLK